jgi:hypothetical protein
MLTLQVADRRGLAWAQDQVSEHHYLHAPVDPRCSPFAYIVECGHERVGCLIFGRPQATACYTGKLTYGSSDDVLSGKARYDRWEILNLARVWLDPRIQQGGSQHIPRAASMVIKSALGSIGYDYLMARPPVDCAFPYQVRCILSYCDTRIHTGYIYMVSRFKLAKTNDDGIQTWMKPIPPIGEEQSATIRRLCDQSQRSKRIRMSRLPKMDQPKLI